MAGPVKAGRLPTFACDCRISQLSEETANTFTSEKTRGLNALHAVQHSKSISLVAPTDVNCPHCAEVCRPHIYAEATGSFIVYK